MRFIVSTWLVQYIWQVVRARRGLRQWLRDDLERVVGLRGSVRLVRREPRVLGRFALYLVVTYGLLVVALALTGHLASLGEWAIYPAVLSGGLFGADLYRSRESTGNDS